MDLCRRSWGRVHRGHDARSRLADGQQQAADLCKKMSGTAMTPRANGSAAEKRSSSKGLRQETEAGEGSRLGYCQQHEHFGQPHRADHPRRVSRGRHAGLRLIAQLDSYGGSEWPHHAISHQQWFSGARTRSSTGLRTGFATAGMCVSQKVRICPIRTGERVRSFVQNRQKAWHRELSQAMVHLA